MSLYTQTPAEALLLGRTLETAGDIAAFLTSGVFVGLSVLVLVLSLARAGVFSGQPLTGAAKACTWFVLGWIMLRGVATVRSGPVDAPSRTWAEMPGLQPDRAGLSERPTARGLALVNAVFDEFSAALVSVVERPTTDPRAIVQELTLLQASMVPEQHGGRELLGLLDELRFHCPLPGPTSGPQVPLTDLFADLASSGVPGVDCADLRHRFEVVYRDAAQQMSDALVAPDTVAGREARTQGRLDLMRSTLLGNVSPRDKADFLAKAQLEQAAREHILRVGGGANPLRQLDATLTRTSNEYTSEVLLSGDIVGEVATTLLASFDATAPYYAEKAEAARQFNEWADLIPTLRGFLFSIFALTFPFVAYALALGFWRLSVAWFMGRLTLSLYAPLAMAFAHVTQELSGWGQTLDDPELAWLNEDIAVVGALSTLETIVVRAQTVYLGVEIALFSVMLVSTVGLSGLALMNGQRAIASVTHTAGGLAARAAGGAIGGAVAGPAGATAGAQAATAAASSASPPPSPGPSPGALSQGLQAAAALPPTSGPNGGPNAGPNGGPSGGPGGTA